MTSRSPGLALGLPIGLGQRPGFLAALLIMGGGVACTSSAPPVDRDGAACDFSASYEYGYVGGSRTYAERSFLSPGNQYRHTRTSVQERDAGTLLSCMPAMPPCGAVASITAYDIEIHYLPLADVQRALAQTTPPLYGIDERPFDGVVFELMRSDGRGFQVGDPCTATSGPTCLPLPAGIAQIRRRLEDLDKQQLAAPDCQAFLTP